MASTKIKSVLKTIRSSQPFNWTTTSLIKSLFAFGDPPELIRKHLPRCGTVRVKLPNGRWLYLWSQGDDWIASQVYWRGWADYEPDVAPLYFRLASKARVTLDIGAHVGFYSLLAAHANPVGRIYAFEPLPQVFERLHRNIVINDLMNVNCIKVAIGTNDGMAELFYEPEGIPSDSSLSSDISRFHQKLQRLVVPVRSIDSFVFENNLRNVDVVKIDTETTELQVLLGMVKTVQASRPIIFCEMWGAPGRAFDEILFPLGYRYYDLTDIGPVSHKGSNLPKNFLFTTLGEDEVSRL